MSDSTDLGSLPPVTGQRRNSTGDPFPKDEPSYEGPVEGENAEPDEDLMSAEDRQCLVPKNRQVWNSDAGAAKAVKAMLAYAQSNGTNIFQLEHGAMLRKLPNGKIENGIVKHGTAKTVVLDPTGVTPNNWVGDIHTHPSGIGMPSVHAGGDWDTFVDGINRSIKEQRGDINELFMYVVVADANASSGYRIYAYGKDSDPNQLGYEVDPDADYCPY